MPLERDALLAYVASGWALPPGFPLLVPEGGAREAATVDVGARVREVSQYYLLTEPNRATPLELRKLVAGLERYTKALGEEASAVASWLPGADEQRWLLDFARWQGRLKEYRKALEEAGPQDRKAVLWSVTAPLLLGFYGGADSDKPQQVADVATPFALTNQLEVREDFERENWQRLKDDIKRGAVVAGLGLGTIVLIAAGVLLALRLTK